VAKVSDVVDLEQQDEPVTELPEHAVSDKSRDGLRQAALEEGIEAASGADESAVEETVDETVERLAEKEELTVADLRELAGKDAEGLTDEQLIAEYEKAEKAGEYKLPFPVYDVQGNKIDDVSKLTVQDLLDGKVQIGYNAMGKEQRKALADVLRVAANGHLNESKMATTLAERNQSYERLQEIRKEHEQWAADRKVWQAALNAAAAGNVDPLQRIINAYVTESGRVDATPASPETDRALEAAGQQFVLTTIVPTAYKLAADYGADATEVTNAILAAIQNEPVEFLTREKIQQIMEYEIPSLLEQNGYARNGAVAQADGGGSNPLAAEVAALKARLQELTADKANSRTAALRRKAPAAGGGSVSSAGDSMPAMKSREDMKRWLRGEGD